MAFDPFAPQPVFVLVRPQMGENIGAAARAMFNFGLTRMRIVDPRDGWPNSRAAAMASGAGRVLDSAGLLETTSAAVADCDFVFATTARARDLSKPVFTPEHAMAHAAALIGDGQSVAVLFGPERTGLENDAVARANAIVTVPVNPAFPSLNLAQCVLLTAYEWQLQRNNEAPVATPRLRDEPASVVEIEKLSEHYERRLDEVGFFYPPTKAASMKMHLRNMWSRMPLSRSDVQMFHGMLRQLLRGRG